METDAKERPQDMDASSRIFSSIRDKCVERKQTFSE